MSYEFNEQEDQVFLSAAYYMKVVGVLLMIVAVLGVLSSLKKGDYADLVSNALNIVVAAFLLRAASAFKKIILTEGDDLKHTMVALRSLRGYFFIQAAAFLIVVGTIGYGVLRYKGIV